jgi:hypothetical protein
MRSLLVLALVAAPIMAAGNTSSATAKSYVNIVAPVFVESTQGLSFGTVLMDSYTQGGTVALTTETKKNMDPEIKSLDFVGCSAATMKGASKASPAFFHFKKDSRYDVNVTVEGKVNPVGLVGATVAMGAGVTLNPWTDLPADACGIFNPLPNSVDAYHFGVGGTLTIAPNTFGEKEGDIHVIVAYK